AEKTPVARRARHGCLGPQLPHHQAGIESYRPATADGTALYPGSATVGLFYPSTASGAGLDRRVWGDFRGRHVGVDQLRHQPGGAAGDRGAADPDQRILHPGLGRAAVSRVVEWAADEWRAARGRGAGLRLVRQPCGREPDRVAADYAQCHGLEPGQRADQAVPGQRGLRVRGLGQLVRAAAAVPAYLAPAWCSAFRRAGGSGRGRRAALPGVPGLWCHAPVLLGLEPAAAGISVVPGGTALAADSGIRYRRLDPDTRHLAESVGLGGERADFLGVAAGIDPVALAAFPTRIL
ncbi:hypothetical protein, partial [Pseudomonas sp. FEN]